MIKKLLTLSNGITYHNNKYLEKLIKRMQRELSIKTKKVVSIINIKMRLTTI